MLEFLRISKDDYSTIDLVGKVAELAEKYPSVRFGIQLGYKIKLLHSLLNSSNRKERQCVLVLMKIGIFNRLKPKTKTMQVPLLIFFYSSY